MTLYCIVCSIFHWSVHPSVPCLQARVHDSIFEPDSPSVEDVVPDVNPISTEFSKGNNIRSQVASIVENAGAGESSQLAFPADSGTVQSPLQTENALEGGSKPLGNEPSMNTRVAKSQPTSGPHQPGVTTQDSGGLVEKDTMEAEKQGGSARRMDDWPLAAELQHKVQCHVTKSSGKSSACERKRGRGKNVNGPRVGIHGDL